MSRTRIAVALLTLSFVAGVQLLTSEGFTEVAAVPVKGDVPTNGFGSTTRPDGTPVKLGDRTTPVEGLQRSLAYLQQAETGLRSCVTVPLHQAEYDVYLDFAYQYGIPTLCASSIAAHLNAKRYEQACHALLAYRYMTSSTPVAGWDVIKRGSSGTPTRWGFDCSTPGNKVCAGVWTRQQARHERCMEAQQ